MWLGASGLFVHDYVVCYIVDVEGAIAILLLDIWLIRIFEIIDPPLPLLIFLRSQEWSLINHLRLLLHTESRDRVAVFAVLKHFGRYGLLWPGGQLQAVTAEVLWLIFLVF